MGHGLPQFGFFIRVLNEIHLIDDVDQVPGFGDTPEHLIDADPNFPFAVAGLAKDERAKASRRSACVRRGSALS